MVNKVKSTPRIAPMKATKSIKVNISPEMRLMMLGASTSGMLGERAYKKLLKLEPTALRQVAMFCELVADEVEKEG
jgi:hypothetical protein